MTYCSTIAIVKMSSIVTPSSNSDDGSAAVIDWERPDAEPQSGERGTLVFELWNEMGVVTCDQMTYSMDENLTDFSPLGQKIK